MTFTASMGNKQLGIYTCISCMKSNIACLLGLVSCQGGTMMSSEMEVFLQRTKSYTHPGCNVEKCLNSDLLPQFVLHGSKEINVHGMCRSL